MCTAGTAGWAIEVDPPVGHRAGHTHRVSTTPANPEKMEAADQGRHAPRRQQNIGHKPKLRTCIFPPWIKCILRLSHGKALSNVGSAIFVQFLPLAWWNEAVCGWVHFSAGKTPLSDFHDFPKISGRSSHSHERNCKRAHAAHALVKALPLMIMQCSSRLYG